MTNYQSMANRIRKAKTIEALQDLDKKMDDLYNFGVFTTNERGRLDKLYVDCLIKLQESLTNQLIEGLNKRIDEIIQLEIDPYERIEMIAEFLSGEYITSKSESIHVAVNTSLIKNSKVVQLNSVLFGEKIVRQQKPFQVINFLKKMMVISKA